jgi:hypothetical protein
LDLDKAPSRIISRRMGRIILNLSTYGCTSGGKQRVVVWVCVRFSDEVCVLDIGLCSKSNRIKDIWTYSTRSVHLV